MSHKFVVVKIKCDLKLCFLETFFHKEIIIMVLSVNLIFLHGCYKIHYKTVSCWQVMHVHVYIIR